MADDIEQTAGEHAASGVIDAAGTGEQQVPPPTEDMSVLNARREADEHPAIGGNADLPSGVQSNVGETDEQRSVREAQERQNAPPDIEGFDGSPDSYIAAAKQQNEKDLDQAEKAVEKMIDAAAGKQVEPFTADEAQALSKVQAFTPHIVGSAGTTIQNALTGAGSSQPNVGIIADLLHALAFIRALQNLI